MTLHIKLNINEKTGEELSYGKAEIWAEDCVNESEKMIARILSATATNTLQMMSNFATALFEKPKGEIENE